MRIAFGRAVALVVGTVLLGASLAAAQEKVQIKPNLAPGMSWTFVINEQMDLNTTMSAMGQQQQIPQRASRRISGSAEVLDAKDGVPTAMRFSFDRESGGQVEMMGQSQPIPYALAGQTVTVRLEDGEFSHDYEGPLDDGTASELRNLVETDDQFLPREPVGVGDSWSPDREALARAWQIDPQTDKFDVNLTVKDLTEREGRKVAVVDMVANIEGEFPDLPGVTGSRRIKGTAVVDVQTGRVTGVDAGGVIEGAGTTDMQGMQVQINAQGTLANRSESKWTSTQAGAVAPPPAPLPAPAPQPGIGFKPPQPPATLAGTYSGDELTLELTEQDGRYTGTVAMGDQKFPLKATAQGNQLTGTFTSGGHDFPFTATLDGQKLTFVTGETTYELNRTGGGAGRNPLAR